MDPQVIRADTPGQVTAWLDEQGLAYTDEDRAAFQSYIDRGWCFVVARMDGYDPEDPYAEWFRHIGVHYEPAPPWTDALILEFGTREPVYPLFAGTGLRTGVLLYTVADHRLESDALRLRAAVRCDDGSSPLDVGVPGDAWPGPGGVPPDVVLCRLTGFVPSGHDTLTLQAAETDEEYRERDWRW